MQQLYKMGICFSCDQVIELKNGRFIEEGVVVSACLRMGLFTVVALNDLDHNPSATTAISSFHSTGISFLQFPTKA